MAHPRLNGSGVHATGQPQARGGMAQIVQATALPGGRPLHRLDTALFLGQDDVYLWPSTAMTAPPQRGLSVPV